MSSIKEELLEDMKQAMKDKNNEKLCVIRMVRAVIKNAEIEQRKDLDDDEVALILNQEIGQRQTAEEEYYRLGQLEEAQRLGREIKILSNYLPPTHAKRFTQ